MYFASLAFTIAAAIGTLSLAGCAVERPTSVTCDGLEPAGAVLVPVQVDAETFAADMMLQGIAQAAKTDPQGPITLNVLSLSSGGQYGAFGAGFLRGWSENTATPRPAFDLVTGVSAGAILAPIAFAGVEYEAALDTYRGLSEKDVLIRRPIFAIPSSPSAVSPAPLERLLRARIDAPIMERLAQRHEEEGARVLISAVNIDTAENRVFDLGAIAAAPQSFETRQDCIVTAMLASGAVPAIFPPRNIDDALYADGGLRDHVFFQAIESARAQAARQTGRNIRVQATIVVNGALTGATGPADDSIIGYLARSSEILADEVLRDSITEAITFAEQQRGWNVRGIFASADISACGADVGTGTFDACVTRILFDHGRQVGRGVPIDWKSADELRDKANEL